MTTPSDTACERLSLPAEHRRNLKQILPKNQSDILEEFEWWFSVWARWFTRPRRSGVTRELQKLERRLVALAEALDGLSEDSRWTVWATAEQLEGANEERSRDATRLTLGIEDLVRFPQRVLPVLQVVNYAIRRSRRRKAMNPRQLLAFSVALILNKHGIQLSKTRGSVLDRVLAEVCDAITDATGVTIEWPTEAFLYLKYSVDQVRTHSTPQK
jgi:hypothetical protein